jgi:HK97 gp10 family phage protein
MSKRDVIWVEGEKQLYMNMQRIMGANISAARQSLAEAGMLIVNDAKNNLRSNHSVVTGQLRKSGRAQAVEGDPDAVDVGFFSDNTQGGYAAYVEYGRRSGKMPPVEYLIQWVRKKLRLPEKEARSRGWAMARSIARKGTKPHPFFTPAVEKNKKAVTDAIQEAIRKDIDGK